MSDDAHASDTRDKIARLLEALREYGRHQEGCNAQFGDRYRCRCGWREVKKLLDSSSWLDGH